MPADSSPRCWRAYIARYASLAASLCPYIPTIPQYSFILSHHPVIVLERLDRCVSLSYQVVYAVHGGLRAGYGSYERHVVEDSVRPYLHLILFGRLPGRRIMIRSTFRSFIKS